MGRLIKTFSKKNYKMLINRISIIENRNYVIILVGLWIYQQRGLDDSGGATQPLPRDRGAEEFRRPQDLDQRLKMEVLPKMWDNLLYQHLAAYGRAVPAPLWSGGLNGVAILPRGPTIRSFPIVCKRGFT